MSPLAYLSCRVRPPCVKQAGGGDGGRAAVTARYRLDSLAAHTADLQIWRSNSIVSNMLSNPYTKLHTEVKG